MSDENWILRREREAAAKVKALLELRIPKDEHDLGEDVFDPWLIMPMYGSYDGAFDVCALDVLREIRDGRREREDLAADMFREILCYMDLCDFGTSPRGCFPTPSFRLLLPDLITKWEAFSAARWAD